MSLLPLFVFAYLQRHFGFILHSLCKCYASTLYRSIHKRLGLKSKAPVPCSECGSPLPKNRSPWSCTECGGVYVHTKCVAKYLDKYPYVTKAGEDEEDQYEDETEGEEESEQYQADGNPTESDEEESDDESSRSD